MVLGALQSRLVVALSCSQSTRPMWQSL